MRKMEREKRERGLFDCSMTDKRHNRDSKEIRKRERGSEMEYVERKKEGKLFRKR